MNRIGWTMMFGIFGMTSLTSCRGLTTPSVVENSVPRMEFFSGELRDSDGDVMTDTEVLFDNRPYEDDEADWLLFRFSLDPEGRFVIPWRMGRRADFEVIPSEALGAPSYRILSVVADTTTIELTYPMVEQQWSLLLPETIHVTEGTIRMGQRRPRDTNWPLYTDRFTLEMDSMRVVRGWVGPGLWSIRSEFEGPNDEYLSFDFADSVRPDSSVFAMAASALVPRQVSIVWPDSLVDDLDFEISAWGKDSEHVTYRMGAQRSWTRSTWLGIAAVPTGDYRIGLDFLGSVQSHITGSFLDVFPENNAPVVLYAGRYWVRISLSDQWPANTILQADLTVGFRRVEADVSVSEPALFLLDEGTYLLRVEDENDVQLRNEVLDVRHNFRISIDPPVAAKSR